MPKGTIVWIEDDIDIIYDVVVPLQSTGYEIVKIYSIREAGKRIREVLAADLVLLDMIAPEPSGQRYPGLEFMRELREKHGIKRPVIALTVVADDNVRKDLESLGVTRILRKPVLPSELLRQVEEALGYRSPET